MIRSEAILHKWIRNDLKGNRTTAPKQRPSTLLRPSTSISIAHSYQSLANRSCTFDLAAAVAHNGIEEFGNARSANCCRRRILGNRRDGFFFRFLLVGGTLDGNLCARISFMLKSSVRANLQINRRLVAYEFIAWRFHFHSVALSVQCGRFEISLVVPRCPSHMWNVNRT